MRLTNPAQGYVPAIDGVRAFSILLVLLSHAGLGDRIPGGFGVTVFFFISGYLIAGLMLDEDARTGGFSLPQFYIRRALRLVPALLAYVLLTSAVFTVVTHVVPWRDMLAAIFYVANYYGIFAQDARMPYGPLWSLAVEEHFYLAFPLLFLALRRHRQALLWTLCALCAAVLAWRVFLVTGLGVSSEYIYRATDCQIDSIIYGVLLAVVARSATGVRLLERVTHPGVFVVAGVALLTTFLIRDEPFRYTVRYSIQGLALFVLISAVLGGAHYRLLRKVLELPVLTWIGRLSYSLYLWHYAVITALQPLGLPLVAHMAAGVALSFVAAVLSYRLVEQPFIGLRKRFGSHAAEPTEPPATV